MPYTGPILNATEMAEPDFPVWCYGYVPSLAMGILGVVLFSLIAVPHTYYLFTKRGTRSVHLMFHFTGLLSALSYGCRLTSTYHPFNGMSFMLGIAGIQISSILVAAAIYKSIQRGLKYWPTKAKLSPMRPRSLIAVFLIMDSVCAIIPVMGQYLFVAAEAAGIFGASPLLAIGTANVVFIYASVLQAISLAVVIGFVIAIIRRADRDLAFNPRKDLQYPHLKPLMIQILISLGLFYVRILTRIAEGAQGLYEYASLHEWVFGVFEALPIFLICLLWAVRPLHKFIFPFGHPKDVTRAQGEEGDAVVPNLNTTASGSSADADPEDKV